MAAYFWVGGSGTWDNSTTTNWASTSGGSGGAGVPTSADTATFDTNSGTSATVTVAATAVSLNTTIDKADINLSLSGSPTLCTTAGTLTFTQGIITLNDNTLSTGIFSSSNINTRSISFGSGGIALTNNSGATVVLAMATATGFSYTGTGGFVRNAVTTATFTFGTTGGTVGNAPQLTVNAGSSPQTITDLSAFKNLDFTGSTCIVQCNTGPSVYGNLTLGSGTYTSLNPRFNASGTLTPNGKSIGSLVILNVSTVVTLASAAVSASGTFLVAGTLNLAGFNFTTTSVTSSNTNVRSITFGSGSIALTGSATILGMDDATNFTCTGTGGFTRNNVSDAIVVFGTIGGTVSNAPNLTVTAGANLLTITTGSFFKDVNFAGSTSTVTATYNACGSLTLAAGGTYTIVPTFIGSGTVDSAGKTFGNTIINRAGITVTLASALTLGTTNTLTLTLGALNLAGFTLSCGIFSSTNSNARSVAFGVGNIALTSTVASTFVLSMAIATGFTWTGTGGFTRNMVATASMRFGSTSGATASNAPNLTFPGGSSALTLTTNSSFKNIDLTNCFSTVSATINIYGNLTLYFGGYASFVPTFLGTSTITTLGSQLGSTTINGVGITVTLAGALVLSSIGTLTLTQGTFNAVNFAVTVGLFSSDNSNTRVLNMGSGQWAVLGSGATAWNTATTTGLTVTPGTSTITMTSASAKTFAGGGRTYYNLNQGGAGALTISGSNTFNDISDSSQPSTVTFTAGTAQTVSNFSLAGVVGSLVTINSTIPGTRFTLTKASGTVNAQYLSITDSNANGGAVWNAGPTNVNGGNNLGWIFPVTGNMFLMFS